MMIQDIIGFVKKRLQPQTLQGLIGMEVLFHGFIVKHWMQESSSNRMSKYNKILV